MCLFKRFLITSFLIITTSYADTVSPDTKQISRFRVSNQCHQTIWVQQDFKK